MQTFSLRTAALLLFISPAAHAITDAELSQAAEAVNQQAPLMVDDETRLDGADAGKQSLTYHYTLVNYSVGELDANKFKEALRPNLLKAGCETLKPLLSEGIKVQYLYHGKNKADIASVVLTASDCGF